MLTRTLTDTTTTTAPYSTSGQTRTWTYTWSNFLLASVKTPRTDVNGLTKFTYDFERRAHGDDECPRPDDPDHAASSGRLAADHRRPERRHDEPDLRSAAAIAVEHGHRPRPVRSRRATATTRRGIGSASRCRMAPRLTTVYDAAHRLTGVTDLLNQSVAYTLDAQGDRTQSNVADANGAILQRTHSAQVRCARQVDCRTSAAPARPPATLTTRTATALTVTDPLSRVTHRAFDALNRLIAITDAAGGVTTTSYDAHDRPVQRDRSEWRRHNVRLRRLWRL